MIRKTLLASLLVAPAILGLSLPATARPTMLKDITVTADLDAIQNPAAAKYWSNVAADLKDALAARLVDRIGAGESGEGATLAVDVDELALANSFQTQMGMDDAVLSGQVNLSSATDNTDFKAYKLTVTSTNAAAYSADGKPLVGAFNDTPEYYQAMIRAFADTVAKNID